MSYPTLICRSNLFANIILDKIKIPNEIDLEFNFINSNYLKKVCVNKIVIPNNNDYVFYNQISTDCFSCSLLFIQNKYKDKKFGDKLPKIIDEDDKFTKLENLNKN